MGDDDAVEAAVATLERRAQALIAEQNRLRLRIVKDAIRDREISQSIGGCISGANALGYSLELSGREVLQAGGVPRELKAYVDARGALIPLLEYFAARVPPELEEVTPAIPARQPTPAPQMPKVADVILERLKEAGATGAKAADMRRYIAQTYHQDIHEKTVGMTLYRLQKSGSVSRDGHTWFLAEARNPGLLPPGSNNSQT